MSFVRLLLRMRLLVLILVLVLVLVCVGVSLVRVRALTLCTVWYHCPITRYYGQYQEHGTDLFTHGLPITARLSGTITFDHWECWDGECVQDITWRLDTPALAGGSRYAYVQIATSQVHVGQHVTTTTVLGRSGLFMEFGLTPDWAYGVSNWRWGVNPLFLLR